MEVKGAAQAGIQSCINEWVSAFAAKAPLRNAPRIGKKCSGALKNTSHLGQKDARDKRARGNDG